MDAWDRASVVHGGGDRDRNTCQCGGTRIGVGTSAHSRSNCNQQRNTLSKKALFQYIVPRSEVQAESATLRWPQCLERPPQPPARAPGGRFWGGGRGRQNGRRRFGRAIFAPKRAPKHAAEGEAPGRCSSDPPTAPPQSPRGPILGGERAPDQPSEIWARNIRTQKCTQMSGRGGGARAVPERPPPPPQSPLGPILVG